MSLTRDSDSDDWWEKGFEEEMNQVVIKETSSLAKKSCPGSSMPIGGQHPMHVATSTATNINTATTRTRTRVHDQQNSTNMARSSANTNINKNTNLSAAAAASKSDAQKNYQSMVNVPLVDIPASLTTTSKLKVKTSSTKPRRSCGWRGPRLRRRRQVRESAGVVTSEATATGVNNKGLVQRPIKLIDNGDVLSHSSVSTIRLSQELQDDYDISPSASPRAKVSKLEATRLRTENWIQSSFDPKDCEEIVDSEDTLLPIPAKLTRSRSRSSQDNSVNHSESQSTRDKKLVKHCRPS